MRKAIQILFLLLFVTVTVGLTVTKHYCGKYLNDVRISHVPVDVSCCGEDDEPMGCCHSESESLTLDVDYSVTKEVFSLHSQDLFIDPVMFMDIYSNELATWDYLNNSMERDYGPPLPQNASIGATNEAQSRLQTFLL